MIPISALLAPEKDASKVLSDDLGEDDSISPAVGRGGSLLVGVMMSAILSAVVML
jgi:hypothetical protein